MNIPAPDRHQELREAPRDLCGQYPDEYWRKLDYERILIAAECIGDAYWFIRRARDTAASEKVS
ncbi:MAG: hypothetical protein V1796_00770 [Pseudomonadota bacterium]